VEEKLNREASCPGIIEDDKNFLINQKKGSQADDLNKKGGPARNKLNYSRKRFPDRNDEPSFPRGREEGGKKYEPGEPRPQAKVRAGETSLY